MYEDVRAWCMCVCAVGAGSLAEASSASASVYWLTTSAEGSLANAFSLR